MQIKAENMDQALELAKQSPTLDVGGSVEVREVRPTPDSTGKQLQVITQDCISSSRLVPSVTRVLCD